MARTGVRLLWGTANLFSHPRYAAGAATNPDPEVFAYAAAQVKAHARGHPPPRRRELRAVGRPRGLRDAAEHRPRAARSDQLARFLHAGRRAQAQDRLQGHAAHRAQAAGADQAPVRLRRGDGPRLPRAPRPARASTASTSRSTTRRWPATASTTRWRYAIAHGIFGSVDANRGDYQNGWDTDQFPNSVDELSLALLRDPARPAASRPAGSTSTPSCAARAWTGPTCSTRHIGGIDTLARSLLVAAADDRPTRRSSASARRATPAGTPRWDATILDGDASLASLRDRVAAASIDPRPVSGRQELLENAVNQRLWSPGAGRRGLTSVPVQDAGGDSPICSSARSSR